MDIDQAVAVVRQECATLGDGIASTIETEMAPRGGVSELHVRCTLENAFGGRIGMLFAIETVEANGFAGLRNAAAWLSVQAKREAVRRGDVAQAVDELTRLDGVGPVIAAQIAEVLQITTVVGLRDYLRDARNRAALASHPGITASTGDAASWLRQCEALAV